MRVVCLEIAVVLGSVLSIMETQCIRRQDIAGFYLVIPITAFFSLLYQCQYHMVLFSKSMIPGNSVIQRIIKAFAVFTVYTTACRAAVRQLSRHKVVVMEKLISRSYIKVIGYIKRQLHLSIKYSIQYRIAFIQIKILAIKFIIITAFHCTTHRILYQTAIFISIVRIRTVAQHIGIPVIGSQTDGNIPIRAVLEIHIGTDFQPVSHFTRHLQVGTHGTIIITLDSTLILLITERHVVAHTFTGTGYTGIVVLIDTGTESLVIPVMSFSSQEVSQHSILQAQTLGINA